MYMENDKLVHNWTLIIGPCSTQIKVQ